MNIRPMEMQVLIPKATEVSKIQQIDANKGNLQQQEAAAELQKTMLERQQQVQHTSQSEGRKLEKDKDSNEKQKQSQEDDGEGKKEQKKEGAANVDPFKRGTILDINT